ncbi:MAG: hypothetical protein PHS14_02665 [Elusimicrobia bacterium]|nr:hypothetical protein [Elusimicrobiota bacterium]
MRNGYRFWAAIVLVLGGAAAGRAQDDLPDRGERKPAVYLRSPDERLSRLTSVLSLGRKREDKARRILEGVDAEVRRAIAAGNAKLRLLLSGEETDAFDGLRDDTEGAPKSSSGTRHLTPSPGLDKGGGGRGSQGGQGQGSGGGSGGGRGGRGGAGGGGGMSGGGGRGGMTGQGGSGSGAATRGGGMPQGGGARGYCGDGVCDQVETDRGICPKDSGQSQGQPAQE